MTGYREEDHPRNRKGEYTDKPGSRGGGGESDISLGAEPYEMTTMPIDVNWYTYELPSPRHRKEVRVDHTATADIEIRSTSSSEAPVAMTLTEPKWDRDGNRADITHDYRNFMGHLYLARDFDTEALQQEIRMCTLGSFETEQEGIDDVQRRADKYVLIDGQAWERATEPVYYVRTFGMGGNHGSTALFSDSASGLSERPENIFRADQFEQARAHAIKVAGERGDTESAARLANEKPSIQVHDPDAIKMVVSRPEPREVAPTRERVEKAAAVINDMLSGRDWHSERLDNYKLLEAKKELDTAFARLTKLTDDPAGVRVNQDPMELRAATWRE